MLATKKKTNKCSNRPFWRDPATNQIYQPGSISLLQRRGLEYWDSQLEFKAYCELRKYYNPDQIYRQHRLFILPKTDIFPALTWDIDFAIITPAERLFIEAKGKWILADNGEMSSFCKMLRILSMTNPLVFSQLKILSDSAWKLGNTKIITIPINEYRKYVGQP